MGTLLFIVLLPLGIASAIVMASVGLIFWRYIIAGLLWLTAIGIYFTGSIWIALAVFMAGCLLWVSKDLSLQS